MLINNIDIGSGQNVLEDFLIYFSQFSFKIQLILFIYALVFAIIFYELLKKDKELTVINKRILKLEKEK